MLKKNIITIIMVLGVILVVLSVICRSALDILSVIASIYGGMGTLLAIKISTDQTNEIQSAQQKEIEKDRNRQDREARKEFCDKIAEDIAIYTTDISQYFYALNQQAHLIEQIKGEKNNLRNQCVNTNTSTYLSGKHAIEELENQKNAIVCDRTTAIRYYYLLMIKLKNIVVAQNLLVQLNDIHNHSSSNTIDEATQKLDKLQMLTVQFMQDYTK